MTIYRRFLDLEDGQIHYREAGSENTVKMLMLHASPGFPAPMDVRGYDYAFATGDNRQW